jgi:hypothetical protein
MSSAERRHFLIAGLLGAACIVAVVSDGVSVVKGSSRPYDIDQFRDIAAAQSIADGRGLQDPFYVGETIWYSPLLPATVAFISRTTGGDVPTAFVLSGPFLNALAPIALFAVAAVFFGPWVAAIAVVSCLFLPPHDSPAWATPGYSPWLFPANFSLVFFYVGLLLCWVALRRRCRGWWLASGLWLGLTTLAHPAPAIVLGACMFGAILIASSPVESAGRSQRVILVLIVTGGAIAMSAPLLWSIVARYHLHVLNSAPNNWAWDAIDVRHARSVLRGALSVWNVPVAVGLVVVGLQARRTASSGLIAGWTVTAFTLFMYGWLQQAIGFDRLPVLLPQYHFFLYLRSVAHILFGVGTWLMISSALSALSQRLEFMRFIRTRERGVSGALVALLLVGIIFDNSAAYRKRPDFRRDRSTALDLAWNDAATDIRGRLRRETSPNAIVLASPDDSVFEVAPAGRRVVAVPREFSNPYVDYETRAWGQRRMLDTLLTGDFPTFKRYAQRHQVSNVLLQPPDLAKLDALGRRPIGMKDLSRRGGVALFELEPKAFRENRY